jgi:hypothetical protein
LRKLNARNLLLYLLLGRTHSAKQRAIRARVFAQKFPQGRSVPRSKAEGIEGENRRAALWSNRERLRPDAATQSLNESTLLNAYMFIGLLCGGQLW